MWLVTTEGFYSAVAHRDLPGHVLIRARVKEDLRNLERVLPGVRRRIFRDETADYPWRAVASAEEWSLAVARLSVEVDYDNFKSAVGNRQGHRRAGVYHGVWDALTRLEPNFHGRYYRARWLDWPETSEGLLTEEDERKLLEVLPKKGGRRRRGNGRRR